MNDRPTAGELVDAVRLFLEKELLPGLSDQRQRFQALSRGGRSRGRRSRLGPRRR